MKSLLGEQLFMAIITLESVLMLATAGFGEYATSVQGVILWTNLGYVSILYMSYIICDLSVPAYSNARECLICKYDIPVGFPPGITFPREDCRSRA